MKPMAEQKRRHEMVSGGGRGGGRIPEDVVALILSRLPLKPLCRFEAVSKSWHQLIQTLNLHPFLRSLFFDGGGIEDNSALSFLPISKDIRVIDCCNGFLLLYQEQRVNYLFYICNPLTKSWTEVCGLNLCFTRMDYDPKVSPHFKIVSFDDKLRIKVLSSETPRMTWKHYERVRLEDLSDPQYYFLMPRHQHRALWEGSIYLLCTSSSTSTSSTLNFADSGIIMRFQLLEDHVADRQIIDLPKGTKKPSCVGIGRLRNKLCLAGLDWISNPTTTNASHHQLVPRLRVWSLSNRDQTVWVLEHDNIINSSHLLCPPVANDLEESTYIGQFHPFLNVVFILSKNMVYAYNLKNFSLNEVCRITSKEHPIEGAIFPFLPSMVEFSTQWETTLRNNFSIIQKRSMML